MSEDFASLIKYDVLPYFLGEGLDVGCGDHRPWDFAVGIDHKAGTTGRGPNQIRDGCTLDKYFAAESQDFVFSSHMLQEVDDWPAVLASWWKLIKPDGYLILFLPIQEAKPGEGENPPLKASDPKMAVDAMAPLKPWQFVEARTNGDKFFHVYRKCDLPTDLNPPDPEKICAVVKLGAHGDAMWASSVFPHLKEQGFYTILYCQETTEEILRHDPHIDKIHRFSSKVQMGELGELFLWIEKKYKNSRILIECVEGTLLPSPTKMQYQFPQALRQKLMNHNYLEVHHLQARVPLEPRQKFYPNDEEKGWANEFRANLSPYVVVLVPNGSSVTKMWPYAGDLCRRLLAERDDLSIVVLGDLRETHFDDHVSLHVIGTTWPVRRAFTFSQLADVVIGQETGLLNCVAHEPEIRKVVMLTHSTVENLTRDWPNTVSMREMPECAGDSACHRLHYSFDYCTQDPVTKAAKCQAMISVSAVMKATLPALSRIHALPTLDKETQEKFAQLDDLHRKAFAEMGMTAYQHR